MNDKELLELAAKAAGVDGVYTEENRMIREFCFQLYKYIKTNNGIWNPLTDDGDAFRLAVKLGFPLEFDPVHTCDRDEWATDPYAATRRAITRAAAEIVKNIGQTPIDKQTKS